MSPPLILLGLFACSGGDKDGARPAPDPAATAAPAVDPLVAAKKLFAEGKHLQALKAAEELVAKKPEIDAAWDLAEVTALRGGACADLVDRLSADQALGGRVERHQLLRGVCALETNRLGDALAAARALQAVAPGDAAAIVATAVRKGAPPPEGMDHATAQLVAMATGAPLPPASTDPAAPPQPGADSLPGWRAALIRGEWRLGQSDGPGAAAEASRVEGAGFLALELALPLRLAAVPSEAWTAMENTARAASDAGDAVGAANSMEAALPAAIATWKAEALATLAAELRKAAAGNVEGAAAIAVVEAEAAIRAGLPLRAREAATVASEGASSKARAAWALVLADAMLGDAAGIALAAPALAQPRAAAARDLARAIAGEDPAVPTPGLTGDDAALQAVLAAGWLDSPHDALAAAAESSSADLRLWAQLWGQRRIAGGGSAAPLAAEAHARSWLAGEATGPLPDASHPAASGWNDVIAASPGSPTATGVAAWAAARTALMAGDSATAARAYGALGLTTPAWRTGPWAPLLVLDGPEPGLLGGDAAAIQKSADPLPVAVAMHGWAHRREATLALWHNGVTPFPPTASAEQRAAVWDAVAQYRAGVLAWLAGAANFPTKAAASLTAAEQAGGLQAFQSPSINALRSAVDNTAILSFRPVGAGYEALVLTPSGGRLLLLRDQVEQEAAEVLSQLQRGSTPVAPADRLRERTVDLASAELLGIGRYVVVGAPPLGLLPIEALPEQADGLRYLADIRNVGYLPDFDAIGGNFPPYPDEYEVALLAFCANPSEADIIRRTFAGAVVLEGKDATVDAWKKRAGIARFLFLGEFATTGSGGWQLSDGVLSLADVAATGLTARSGYVSGSANLAVASARIAALRRAGLRDVLVGSFWQDPTFHNRILTHYWENMSRRYNASRSYGDARALSIKEVGPSARQPVDWGGYFVAGLP